MFYQSGVCLSTNLGRRVYTGSPQSAPRASLKWSPTPNVDGDEAGAPFVFARANTDPNVATSYFVRSTDPADRDAVCINAAVFGKTINFGIVTHYIGDPGYAGEDGMSFAFEYQGDFISDKSTAPAGGKQNESETGGLTLEVTAHDWTPLAQRYTAHLDTATGGNWQPVALSVSQFRSKEGKPLQSWRGLDKLEIRGTATKENPPRFRRFHWAER